jgi:hypothetical protein
MQNSILLFNPAEQEIRRKWLFWVIKLPVSLLIMATLAEVIELLFNLDQFNAVNFYTRARVTTLVACMVYIYYSCAYRTPGTGWLSLLLGLAPIRIIISWLSIKNIKSEPNLDVMLSLIATFFLNFMYEARIFYLSLQLTKINQALQNKIFLSSKKYLSALTSLLSALTIHELNESYKILIENNSSVRFRMHLTKAYEEKKQTF